MSFANANSNNSKVALDLRGTRLSLEREALMELPESVLLCLFPNGVVLSPQRVPRNDGVEAEDEDDEDVYYVDVSFPSSRVLLNLDEPTPPKTSLSSVRRPMPRVCARVFRVGERRVLRTARWLWAEAGPLVDVADRAIQHAKPTLPQASDHRPARRTRILCDPPDFVVVRDDADLTASTSRRRQGRQRSRHGRARETERGAVATQGRLRPRVARAQEHLYGAAAQREPREQRRRATLDRHAVHERVRARRRVGVPVGRTEPVLHRVDRARLAQDWHRASSPLAAFDDDDEDDDDGGSRRVRWWRRR